MARAAVKVPAIAMAGMSVCQGFGAAGEAWPKETESANKRHHCAKAGEAPNTVAIPAASARKRRGPPAMALPPMRRARKLSEISSD